MIIDNLKQQIVDAMKKGDSVRLSTLKMLSSELHNYQIDHPQMTQDEEIAVIKHEAKKRKDAIDAYTKAAAPDRAEKEKKELEILQEFLPAEMSDEQLKKVVDETISETGIKEISQRGKVIGLVMKKVGGNADGGKVAQLVKEKLK